ncbi:hypothetical protein JTE90_004832 [Oedothorax gibbosus]|uniref:Uncharacterized protein n=1 Tax=Oedothorax gibbosus TaxID=931172 RepID=A0AAV6US66_9ARAC|nr:hypothetical protein JTE90_004832 [Oedothorax gibbosus]
MGDCLNGCNVLLLSRRNGLSMCGAPICASHRQACDGWSISPAALNPQRITHPMHIQQRAGTLVELAGTLRIRQNLLRIKRTLTPISKVYRVEW